MAAMKLPSSMPQRLELAGGLWLPLEGEGTGVDRWPPRKFPLLVDSERNIVETSIIIEYLQLAHPGRVPLLARRFGHPRTSDSSA
jgi:hypothetical protein